MAGKLQLKNRNTESDKGSAKLLNSPKKLVLKGDGRGKSMGKKC